MGKIKNIHTKDERLLPECTVLGRAPTCDIHLREAKASGEHAVVRWTDGSWRVVDLCSRNGTWIDGRKLTAGESVELAPGVPVSFGSLHETWTLVDANEPVAFVRGVSRDYPIEDDLLALPSDTDPVLTIWRDGAGEWHAEHEGERQPVEDREVLRIAGRWRLFLPSTPLPQTELGSERLADARLVIRHDLTEEYVTATLAPRSGASIDLRSYSHLVVLLELARVRLEDRRRGIGPAQEGWVHREELSRRLGRDVGHINIMIFRLRKQLTDADLMDSANIIERMARTGMLRVGVVDVRVHQD